MAVEYAYLDQVRYLLQHGADISAKKVNGYTALKIAQEKNCPDIITYLQHFKKPLPQGRLPSPGRITIIRYWEPKIKNQSASLKKVFWYNQLFGSTETNVGHITISIRDGKEEAYISHWPLGEVTNSFQSYPGSNNTLVNDVVAEKGMPTAYVVLYTLNTEAMITQFQDICEKKARWFIGGYKPAKKFSDENISHSCSSYVYEILEKGGLFDHLLTDKDRLKNPITPFEALSLAKKAQDVETILYPEVTQLLVNELHEFKTKLLSISEEHGHMEVKAFLNTRVDYYAMYLLYFKSDPNQALMLQTLSANIKNSATRELHALMQSWQATNSNNTTSFILTGVNAHIQNGAQLTYYCDKGYNALHWAIHNKNLVCIKTLLEFFPQAVNSEIKYALVTGEDDNSPLKFITRQPINFWFSQQINKNKTVLNKTALPVTALDLAIDVGDEAIINLLIEKGGTNKNRELPKFGSAILKRPYNLE